MKKKTIYYYYESRVSNCFVLYLEINKVSNILYFEVKCLHRVTYSKIIFLSTLHSSYI